MQNNVTELTHKLLNSLDSNYNVIDMPTVIEVISLLEKVAITKELLETTRLGKHVNELRRRTSDDGLSRRAKELLKKWRQMVLPENNGQIKSMMTPIATPPLGALHQQQDDVVAAVGGGRTPVVAAAAVAGVLVAAVTPNKKRAAKEAIALENNYLHAKRPRVNGASELDISDNSNSSFGPDLLSSATPKPFPPSGLIVVNSDSNSSLPDKPEPVDQQQQQQQQQQQVPKKRGRKKGSKNHRMLLDEAESSFSNKLAVSRGNSKVKTTQELIASLQNKQHPPAGSNGTVGTMLMSSALGAVKSKEDLNERAAKLTERVSIIDQKLNPNASRYNRSNQQRPPRPANNALGGKVIESGSVFNDHYNNHFNNQHSGGEDEDAIIVVDDVPPPGRSAYSTGHISEEEDPLSPALGAADYTPAESVDSLAKDVQEQRDAPRSLSIEECRALLPPVDRSWMTAPPERGGAPECTCHLSETKPNSLADDASAEGESVFAATPSYEFVEDRECLAKGYLRKKFYLGEVVDDRRVDRLCEKRLAGINGILSLGDELPDAAADPATGLYASVVPDHNAERLPKCPPNENHEKYCISHRSHAAVPPNNYDYDDAGYGTNGDMVCSVLRRRRRRLRLAGGDDDDDDDDDRGTEEEDEEEECKFVSADDSDDDGGRDDDDSLRTEDGNGSAAGTAATGRAFREWYQSADVPSYNDEPLRILPYVIID